MDEMTQTGIVVKSTGSWVRVRTENGKTYNCRLKGSFRTKNVKSTNPIAVGDSVSFRLEEDGDGVIQEIKERRNYIIRKSVNLSKREHILAANIDLAVILITLKHPETYQGFIDRFLVTAEAYHIPALLVFNKSDLYADKEMEKMNEWMKMYQSIGYRCMSCVANKKESVDQIVPFLKGRITLFSGHSGAGKSTLINTINPQLKLKTSPISDFHLSGKHTTTFAEMIEVMDNTFIVDTPGIKGLGIIDIPKESLSHYFPEFREKMEGCKFHNCLHISEPGCAIKTAVDNKEIAQSRYKSYLSIYYDDEEENYRTVDYN